MVCFHRVLNEEVLGFRLMVRLKKQWEVVKSADAYSVFCFFLNFFRLNF